MITAFIGLTLLIAWIGVFISDRDAWPFSSYPMFSQYLPAEQVNVFRIRIIDANGEERCWLPPASQIGRDFDRGFRESLKQSMKSESEESNQYPQQFFSRWNDRKDIKAIQVVGRSLRADQVILRLSVPEIDKHE